MPGSAIWFAFIVAMLPAAWLGGRACSRMADRLRQCCVIGFVFVMLLGWVWLIQHPAVAVQVIPLEALSHLEGIGAAPLFLFMLGVSWHLALIRRQRAVVVMGFFLGAVYFLQGGLWMVRPTPSNAFAQQDRGRILVEQTQSYSCVPAASATALRMLGLQATEAEMASLTQTRAGSGSTLLRAFYGLTQRLDGSNVTAYLVEPDYEALMQFEPPILTPLQYDVTQRHMVTLIAVRPEVVLVADPQVGLEYLSREEFEQVYRQQAVVFAGGAQRLTASEVLREYSTLVKR